MTTLPALCPFWRFSSFQVFAVSCRGLQQDPGDVRNLTSTTLNSLFQIWANGQIEITGGLGGLRWLKCWKMVPCSWSPLRMFRVRKQNCRIQSGQLIEPQLSSILFPSLLLKSIAQRVRVEMFPSSQPGPFGSAPVLMCFPLLCVHFNLTAKRARLFTRSSGTIFSRHLTCSGPVPNAI